VSPEGLDLASSQAAGIAPGKSAGLISWLDWLRYGPFLAQVIVTRRCNLSCGYCTEYDKTSEPVPFDVLRQRLELLRDLRTWAVSLMGGEPTLHPDLLRIFSTMRVLGFHRRMMTTNGLLLTKEIVDGLNDSGMTDMSLSIDGVKRNATTVKVLNVLRRKLDILAERAKFDVVVSAVIGTAPREEVLEVVEFAKSRGFTPRLLVLHNEHGQMGLSAEELAVYAEVKRLFGHRVTEEAHGYRERLIQNGEAPFRCRAGHGTSTSMSSEWCGGARRPAWHLERGCPRTPWRIFGDISIRRKPAVTSVAWVASGRRLRSTSGVPNTHPKGSALAIE